MCNLCQTALLSLGVYCSLTELFYFSVWFDSEASGYSHTTSCKLDRFFAIANDCNDQYEGASDTLCIRVSSYPETYEDAQTRCNLEGGQLLQDINPSVHVRNFHHYKNLQHTIM